MSEYLSAVTELRHIIERAAAEARRDGGVDPLTQATLDRLNDRLDAMETDQSERDRKASWARGEYVVPGADLEYKAYMAEHDPATGSDAVSERKAFDTALRTPPENFHLLDASVRQYVKIAGIRETKDMQLSDDAAGGFLAPSQFVSELIRSLVQVSPIRQFARSMQVSGRSVLLPTESGLPEAYWIAELGARTHTGQPDFGMMDIPVHECYAESHISDQLLEDAAIDVETEIRRSFVDRLGQLEADAFLKGDGVGKPQGIVTNATVVSDYTVTASTTGGANQPPAHTFLGDDLVKLVYELPDPYAAGARIFLHRRSVGFVRTLKDTTGQYLWQPGLANDAPATICGLPYSTLVNMDQCGIGDSMSAGKLPVIIGDLGRAYLIADRVQMVVKRLVELYAATGLVAFVGRRRVGGQIILPEAIRVLKTA